MATVERGKVVDLLSSTFDGNPAVHFSIGQGRGYIRRRRALAGFLFDYCHQREGVYLSSDGKGILLAYRHDRSVAAWKTAVLEIKLTLQALGLGRLPQVITRASRIRRAQKRWRNWIHCWYIGVDPGHRDGYAARELQRLLFDQSDASGLPVLAETTMIRNRRAYESVGFVVYGEVKVRDTITWLMVRFPGDSRGDRRV